MLYVYTLTNLFSDIPLEFLESVSQADARSDGDWEFSHPGRLSESEIWEYCNGQWCLPTDGEGFEIIDNYTNIPVARVP